ncbi:MAG: 50S ribosomal protein L6 [Patescibacteria group bacterium]
MSRLIKKSIIIPQSVTVSSDERILTAVGSKGEKKVPILPYLKVVIEGGQITVTSSENHKQARSNQGTMWALIRNAIQGVAEGFVKILEIHGVGYRAAIEGKTLVLNLGFVNPIRYDSPQGVTVVVEKNLIIVSGVDKEAVGQTAAEIRAFKKPEPYKGKGIRYKGEVVRRKAGKKAATAGAAG